MISPRNSGQAGHSAVETVVIVGGGTAGWMSAAALARIAPPGLTITLIESKDIGAIGVGEATIPSLIEFNDFLGLDEHEVLRACQGTFKLGIDFVDWCRRGDRYFHPFGSYGRDTPDFAFHQLWLRLRALAVAGDAPPDAAGDISDFSLCTIAARLGRFARADGGNDAILATMRHAYHFDAKLYARMLRRYAERKGVRRIEGQVVDVACDPHRGGLASVTLDGGRVLAGDLFLDCSGFRSLLIDGALDMPFVDWGGYLPCDRAIAVSTSLTAPPVPYTRATAADAGWRWRIPLRQRTSHGYVYASAFLAQDEAERHFLTRIDGAPLDACRPLKFRTGHRRTFWEKNCVAIGLAGGFIEPLESTGIHLAQMGIQRLVNLWPGRGINAAEIACYNRAMTADYERVRDFIILHYQATRRDDTPFWRHVRALAVPDSLAEKIELFRGSGRIVPSPDDLFNAHSWLAVMLGQGIEPDDYDALVDRVPEKALIDNMRLLKEAIARTAEALPRHEDYLSRHCAVPSKPPG